MNESISSLESYTCKLTENHYKIWNRGVQGKISGQIIIIGPTDYLMSCCEIIRKRTSKPICILSHETPDKNWEKLLKRFDKLFYLECDL